MELIVMFKVMKDMISSSNHVACGQLVLSSKTVRRYFPREKKTTKKTKTAPTLIPLIARKDPCFHVDYSKFWSYHLNIAIEFEIYQTRPFPPPTLFSVVQFWLPHVNRALNILFLHDWHPVLRRCTPSVSRFNLLCIQRLSCIAFL